MAEVDTASIVLSIFLFIVIIVILASSLRIVREYQRAVMFRLGRLLGAKGPGLFFRLPFADKFIVVDLRVLTFDVPKQRIVTRDNVSVDVDAVVYYRVLDPVKAIIAVEHFTVATNLLAQTTLRDVVGQVELDDLLAKREELSKRLTEILDLATDPWGIKVTTVTIKDVSLLEDMQRAIAKQAEAERERRSRIIIAEGEFQAATKMKEAAAMYSASGMAIRLRELQTLTEIAREKNLVVVTTTGSVQDLGNIMAMLQTAKKSEDKP